MRKMSSFLVILIISLGMAHPLPRVVHAQLPQEAGNKPQSGGTGVDQRPRYKGYTEPRYKEITTSSLYIEMRDRTRIAVDVLLPKELPTDAKIPALMHITRYWRARENQELADFQKFLVQHGYALIMVDVRGTGASFGTWTMPWSKDEVKDYGGVVDWIVAQPWSNGKVGAIGNSYGGNSALLMATLNHPAVKAVLPRHYEFDGFADVPYPGGIFNEGMVKTWDESNHELDQGAGVKPVDKDTDRSLLRQAIREHEKNIDLYKAAKQAAFRDDRLSLDAGGSSTLDDISIHSRRQEIERSKVAINNWGGWFDAGTADAVIKSFLTFNNSQRAIIGPWNHGASQNASPSFGPGSQRLAIMFEWLRFFDYHLKGIETGVEAEKVLFYYTVGEERWKKTLVWPVAGTKTMRLYMAGDNSLSAAAPPAGAAPASDTYRVDFEASTGEKNRWRTQLGGPVVYPDRATEDRRLLTYTSQPLTEDTEITGHPVINLYVTSTHSDGAFYVYLEDVDESGKVTYLTEGMLRAIHRKVSTDTPPYTSPAPYHSFRKKDAMPLVPGETAELKFGLLPISVLIRKGHRLRVAIAGHDKSVFARIPAEGTPVISVARNNRHASFIELPVVPRSSPVETSMNLLTYFVQSADKAVAKVDPKIYDAYAGQYELAPGLVITITKEDGKLMGEAPGQPKVELFPESETKFFIKASELKLTFVRDDAGQTSGLILHQGTRELKAKKIK